MDRMGYRHMVIAGIGVRRMDCSQPDSQGMVPPQVVPPTLPRLPICAQSAATWDLVSCFDYNRLKFRD